jgi:hypothetical protein
MGHKKKCVVRIGAQQARHGERWAPWRLPDRRIRREVLQRLEVRVYAIGVDKNGPLVEGREETRHVQAAKNRRKKLLRPLPDSARVRFSHRRSCSFSF